MVRGSIAHGGTVGNLKGEAVEVRISGQGMLEEVLDVGK